MYTYSRNFSGYIALILMLVVSVVSALIALYVLQITIDTYKQSIASTSAIQSAANSHSCIDIALQKIWDAGFASDQTGVIALLGGGSCEYAIIPNTIGAQIHATGYAGGVVRRINVSVTIDTKITVVSLTQVAVF